MVSIIRHQQSEPFRYQMVILHLKAISRYLVKVSKVNLLRINIIGMLHKN